MLQAAAHQQDGRYRRFHVKRAGDLRAARSTGAGNLGAKQDHPVELGPKRRVAEHQKPLADIGGVHIKRARRHWRPSGQPGRQRLAPEQDHLVELGPVLSVLNMSSWPISAVTMLSVPETLAPPARTDPTTLAPSRMTSLNSVPMLRVAAQEQALADIGVVHVQRAGNFGAGQIHLTRRPRRRPSSRP